jgi:hypothetical protein
MINKTIQVTVSGVLLCVLLIWVRFWIENQPPIPPSEVQVLAVVMSLVLVPFIWASYRNMKSKDINVSFAAIARYLQFLVPFHISIHLLCIASFGWFDPDDLGPAYMAMLNTASKGALFDLMESFDLEISNYEPETHLVLWRFLDFVFRLAYSAVSTAILTRLWQLWQMRHLSH